MLFEFKRGGLVRFRSVVGFLLLEISSLLDLESLVGSSSWVKTRLVNNPMLSLKKRENRKLVSWLDVSL